METLSWLPLQTLRLPWQHARCGRPRHFASAPESRAEGTEVTFRGRTFRVEPGKLLRTGGRLCKQRPPAVGSFKG